MTTESELRSLSVQESEILTRLLAANFAGRDEIADQIANCMVRDIDQCGISISGSIDLITTVSDPAPVNCGVPVEGVVEDADGVLIHILLHVVGGIVKELEISKENFLNVLAKINAHKVRVQSNSPENQSNTRRSPSNVGITNIWAGMGFGEEKGSSLIWEEKGDAAL